MERYYTDKGFISKGSCLCIKTGDDTKYHLLIPVADMPQTKGAPSTQAKTVLSDSSVTEVEGLQTNEQKTYTFNYHRDNVIQLKKYAGKPLSFLERNPDNVGEKYTGTMQFGRSALSVDGIVQGQMFITVNSADDEPVDDCRDLVQPTAIITSPLPDVVVAPNGEVDVMIETSVGATVAATSKSTSIATVTYADGKLTITGVAAGNTLIELVTSATNEATSYRTIAVTVESA